MGLIEQAAQRLEQLRQAGVEVPPVQQEGQAEHLASTASALNLEMESIPASPAPENAPPPEQCSRRVDINMSVLAAAGFVRPDAPRSQLADEFRIVKRPLIDNSMGKGAVPVKDGNLIMITSALPGEGKTFTAANLALSIAMELDHTVMLVDADVAKSNLLKMLGLPAGKGLLDVLVDDVTLPQVLLRTNVEKLTILPSGTVHPRATELLASEAMVSLLEELASRYSDRIIIFDSPPLLVTTEARALASHMGQVVMVVKAESTTHSAVNHALAAIEACPVKLMMLNQVKTETKDSYGYGYGYGYST